MDRAENPDLARRCVSEDYSAAAAVVQLIPSHDNLPGEGRLCSLFLVAFQ